MKEQPNWNDIKDTPIVKLTSMPLDLEMVLKKVSYQKEFVPNFMEREVPKARLASMMDRIELLDDQATDPVKILTINGLATYIQAYAAGESPHSAITKKMTIYQRFTRVPKVKKTNNTRRSGIKRWPFSLIQDLTETVGSLQYVDLPGTEDDIFKSDNVADDYDDQGFIIVLLCLQHGRFLSDGSIAEA